MTTTGHDWALQVAIVTALAADTDLKALIGATPRIYQDVPASPTYPYLVIGDSQVVDDSVQGMGSQEIYADVHIWTNNATSPGNSALKEIEACLHRVLHDADLSLSGARCVQIQFDSARNGGAENPSLKHRVVTFRAITEPAS